jgi:VWFA-related protein
MFRTSVTAVVVPFTADDPDNRPILDLKPAECHVFEDGLEQRIGGLTDVAAPVSVALLVDTSRSMGWQKETLRAIPTAAVAGLRTQDKVLIATFDDHIRIQSEFQAAPPGIASALSSLQAEWGTRLYDALHLLIADRLRRVEGRKAIVLITDGVDTGSRLSDPAAGLDAVDASNVAVYVVRCRPRNDAALDGVARYQNFERFVITVDDRQTNVQGDDPVGAYLQRLADGSGGRLYHLEETANLKELFGKIGGELSHQYTLYYYPSTATNDRTYHHITVSVDRPGSVVRARKGYLAAPDLAR